MKRAVVLLWLFVATVVPALAQAPGSLSKKSVTLSRSTSPRFTSRALTGETWDDRFGTLGINGIARAFAQIGSNLYVGGDFTLAGAVPVARLARWDGSAWHPVGDGVNGTVLAMAVSGTDLYVAGNFTIAGSSTAANGIARWDGTTWHALGSGLNGEVRAIAIDGSKVYVAGSFSQAGGVAASNVAVWNGTSWSALGSGVNDRANAIAVAGPDVYVGGRFSQAGGNAAHAIARWNGSSWIEVGGGVWYDSNGSGEVEALYADGLSVYVGGFFYKAGNVALKNIALWSGSAWSAVGASLGGRVYAITTYNSELIAAGNFLDSPSGANYVARFDGTAWSALGTGLGSAAYAALGTSSGLWVGGNFIEAGDIPSEGIARWGTPGTGTTDPDPGPDDLLYTVLRYFNPSDTPNAWGYDTYMPVDTGFVFGTNKWGDQAKATAFQLPAGKLKATLRKVNIYFAFKDPEFAVGTYRLAIYEGTGETGPTGTPIATQEFNWADARGDINGETPVVLTPHTFSTPINVGANFFVAIEYSGVANSPGAFSMAGSDEVDGPVADEWEKNASGTWTNVTETWTDGTYGWHPWIEAVVEPQASEGLIVTSNQVDASGFPTIEAFASITDDSGVPLSGLSAGQFSVKEDGVAQTITSVQQVSSTAGLSVALVIDHSISMIDERLSAAKTAADLFVEMMGPADRAAVIGYSTNVSVVQDFTTDKDALSSAIHSLYADTYTSTYDAMAMGVSLTLGQQGRRAVILMTDGEDNDSEFTLDMATQAAIQAGIPVYIIGLDIASNTSLKIAAEQTGGRYYSVPDGGQLYELYKSLSQQLNAQYRITYTTTNKVMDGTRREVEITVVRDALTQTQTRTYTAPLAETASTLPDSWNCFANTGGNASIAIPVDVKPFPGGGSLKTGDVIGVFYADDVQPFCAGQVTWIEGQPAVLYAWQDDPATTVKDGFAKDDPMVLRAWDATAGVEYTLTITLTSGTFTFWPYDTFVVKAMTGTSVTDAESGDLIPDQFKLHQNYPNPVSQRTAVTFDLPKPSQVTLRVYNALGAEVTTLARGLYPAGRHDVQWEPTGLPSGIYFYRLETDGFTATRRMVVVR